MKRSFITIISIFIFCNISFSQKTNLEIFDFLLGEWTGTGTGFGNDKSKINSEFKLIMNGIYIQIKNHSEFEPTKYSCS